jgi:GAF domain-containing protein
MLAWLMEISPSRVHGSSATATSASTNLPSNPHFPASNGVHSLAEMARRDLDAALQLLADRAQYITGASGAAIALRRHGKKDMLCRASTGPNAPELGALLSTEFGLSGESVRTRQPLRCDDAERDARVNREVCRQLGIASVVVMPVVNDDEVLGVFELFSGEVNAFGERDLSAVQRLSEMVETAVRLAEAAENLPERLRTKDVSAPAGSGQGEVEQDKVLGGQVLEELVLDGSLLGEVVAEELILEDAALPGSVPEVTSEAPAEKEAASASRNEGIVKNVEEAAAESLKEKIPTASPNSTRVLPENSGQNEKAAVDGTAQAGPDLPEDKVESAISSPAVGSPRAASSENVVADSQAALPNVSVPLVQTAASKKQLFWSAALNPAADAGESQDADQSHVPPMLRSLRKCEACGFPVSAGRMLCVECEEKKWRGQLRVPRPSAPIQVVASRKAEARAFAAAQSAAGSATVPSALVVSSPSTVAQSMAAQRKESKLPEPPTIAAVPAADPRRQKPASEPSRNSVAASEFVFSAGLKPSQSWLAANKYVIGVLLVLAVAVAAFVFLR